MAAISADAACCFSDSKSKACSLARDKPVGPLVDGDINKIVERKLSSNNFHVLQWSLDSLGETNGYLGQYYILSIAVKADDKPRSLRFFVKTPPLADSPQYDFLTRFDAFNKEITVYSDIIRRMGNGKGPKWSPDYYFGKNNAVIVLEDATQEGYVMPDKYVPFDLEHCISVVKVLSAFHSRSLILDEKLRRTTGQTISDLYGHLLREVAFIDGDLPAEKYLASCATGACAMVDLVEGWTNEERSVVKNRVTKWIKYLPRLLASPGTQRNVICHRDLWANNIMFKRDEAGKPIGCYLVDFQFFRYCPPAHDLVTCLYLVTNRATRDQYYDCLLQLYYDTMRRELADEDLNVEECLPFKDFLRSCQETRCMSLSYAVSNLQIMLLSKEAVDRYFVGSTDELESIVYEGQRAELVLSQSKDREEYKIRLIEILQEIKERLPDDTPAC